MYTKFTLSVFAFVFSLCCHAQVENISRYKGNINLSLIQGNYSLTSWLKADKGSTTFKETFSNSESWQFGSNNTLKRTQKEVFEVSGNYTISGNTLQIQWNKDYIEKFEIIACNKETLIIAQKNSMNLYHKIIILKKI